MEASAMIFSWMPVVLVDIFGSALTLCIALFCAHASWKWSKQKTDDVFRQYIFLLTLAIVFFAISRSFGHLVKQVLLLNDMPDIWKQISPFSGAINSAIFIIIFAFGIYFHRVQNVHIEIEKFRKNLESVVRERTGQLNETNEVLLNEISERMQAEAELKQSNNTLENVLDSSSPLCITNVNFEIIRANKAYMEIWPKTSTEEGQKIKCYESRPGASCHTENCPLQKVINGLNEITTESAKYNTREGTSTFIISARPFRDPDGNLRGIVESFQDISDRIKAENAKAELIDDLQEALDKVNQLGGLLPICASCKKIRDDKGYWKQIETYIRDHSEAEFSHGICPDCAKKLYPEFYDRVEKVISDRKKNDPDVS
jgi:PAS domain-containing protein